MTAIRTRSRRIQVDDQVTDAMRTAAEEFRKANAAKNEATRAENKAQKNLDQLMAKASDGKPWEFTHVVDGETLDVKYAQPDKEVIDVAKLIDLVDKDKFLATVTASKKAVTDNCGNNIQAACTDTEPGTWKAKVTVRK